MKRMSVFLLVIFAIGFIGASAADAAIRRVAPRYYVFDVYGGYSMPWGEYDEVSFVILPPPIQDADTVFEGTYHVGFHYGVLSWRHVLSTVGFRYTDHSPKDWLVQQAYNQTGQLLEGYRQFDLTLDVNVYPLDISSSFFSPYIGAGFKGGLLSDDVAGFESESKLTATMSANFGADLKIAELSSGAFVTLASVNSFDVFASNDRPKYLNVGGGLRWWFR